MTNLIARAQTLLGSLVTWLVVATAVLTIALEELANYADDPTVAAIVRYVGIILTVVTVAVAIVRRVTTVIPTDRGLLSVDNPTPINSRDAGQAAMSVITTVCIVVVVLFAFYGAAAIFDWDLP